MKRQRGRPPKEPSDLITLDLAIERLKAYLLEKYEPQDAMAMCLAKGTLYNKICKNELHSWRRGKFVLVSEKEVLQLVG
jgi:hypothetical protein